METEITIALIAFAGATCASLIAIGGVMIGLASSYLLHALQRKWGLEDQKRGWKRAILEEALESYKQLDKVLNKVYFDAEYTQEYKTEIKDCVSDFIMQLVPINDSKIEEIYSLYIDKLNTFITNAKVGIEDVKEFREYIYNISDVGEDFLKRINELIEETYK